MSEINSDSMIFVLMSIQELEHGKALDRETLQTVELNGLLNDVLTQLTTT